MALPAFGNVVLHEQPLADGIERENEWLSRAAESGIAAAHLWQSRQALVVTRGYTRLPGWTQACALSADAGWPVHVRGSGGGLVPLGPGVLNLSLAWRAEPAAMIDPHGVYRDLCGALSLALARFGINAVPQEVEASFCDGRFNLAVSGRKIAGTAQAWRRIGVHQAVLAQAVIVVTADPDALTAIANRFEAVAASGRRYRAGALTSVAREWNDAHAARAPLAGLEKQLAQATIAELAEGRRPAAA